MGGGDAIAGVVEDPADQRSLRLAGGPFELRLLVQLGLDSVEQTAVENGWLLAPENLALEDDLADVEAIAQQVRERSAGERNAANCLADFRVRVLLTMPCLRNSTISRFRLPNLR